MADWATVRALALSFPEAEAGSGDRAAFSVRGKGFAWEARERDGGGLAVRVDRDEKELILDSNPDVYFTSPGVAPATKAAIAAVNAFRLASHA